ncbi:hypothetical protein LTR78_004163 [Recurvomyces mirabilis]|uniref:Inhibitor of growth protein N-terminal histone-binding domain-containing protein n=1 Tax=Recurvomyces mirabilis TaxID=574656 RepID=A0AAE1C2S0_9PEZI|nr:hypothetical protein LTR78_004163 [Recurvomyces mirabilis]KAK5153666.1 hypothetical protein LTS14_007360 [Recurvomyces mirabilis]
MPPTSNIRKTSLASYPPPPTENGTSNVSKRTASGRAIRTNTTRPTNYYARHFGGAGLAVDNDASEAPEPGFFPALQFFSDAITALPKEMVRHSTLIKEAEGKVHGPNERLSGMVERLLEMPIPARRDNGGAHLGQLGAGGLLSFTAANSTTGSTNVSLINGVAGGGAHLSAVNSVAGSVIGDEDTEEDLVRRRAFHELRLLIHGMLPNLEEKTAVLTEANRVLAVQLARVDSVMPHIDNEISEEARLGSMTHWAYSDNRVKKHPMPVPSRRDIAATNSLAAVAAAFHETEIAQARREAGKEASRDKVKGKRGQAAADHVDSEFEERPKKVIKGAKGKAATMGLGILANGEPVKRRRVDKSMLAPAMERMASQNSAKGSKANRDTPRSTPAVEPGKKQPKAKPAPLPPKKKLLNSAQNSPALASSPLHSSFNANNMEPPPNGRSQTKRLRNNSTTNLRHERLVGGESSRPTSAAGKASSNGEKATSSKKKTVHDEERRQASERANAAKTTEPNDDLKNEDVEMADAGARPTPSRSNSGKNAAIASTGPRGSKPGTPRNGDSFVAPDATSMLRTRSARSLRGNGREDSGSDTPNDREVACGGVGMPAGSRGHHKRVASNSHLIKQLAPFNRSPDADRHRGSSEESGDGNGEGRSGSRERKREEAGEEDQVQRGHESRPISRRDTQTTGPPPGMVELPEAEGMETRVGNAIAASSPPRNEDLPEEAPELESDNGDEASIDEEEISPAPSIEHGHPPTGPAPDLISDRDDNDVDEEDEDLDEPHQLPESSHHTSHNASHNPSPSATPHPSSEPEAEPDTELSPNPEILNDEEEDQEEEAEDSDEHDPDDPNEPKYCYCDRGSYGEMVACDNAKCVRGWGLVGGGGDGGGVVGVAGEEVRVGLGYDVRWEMGDER